MPERDAAVAEVVRVEVAIKRRWKTTETRSELEDVSGPAGTYKGKRYIALEQHDLPRRLVVADDQLRTVCRKHNPRGG